MNEPIEPKIISYCCRWCSYAAADLAGSLVIEPWSPEEIERAEAEAAAQWEKLGVDLDQY